MDTVNVDYRFIKELFYCLGSVDVNKGDSIDVGKKVGTIGAVPFEAGDENHIHIEVKIDGKYADPLSFINNNE